MSIWQMLNCYGGITIKKQDNEKFLIPLQIRTQQKPTFT